MRLINTLAVLLLACLISLPAAAVDDVQWRAANESIERGVAYLRTQQADDGSWVAEVGPAVTGLVLTAMLDRPDIGPDDPDAAQAIQYILSQAQEDGSIRNGPDGILASYNTAICLSALARVGNDPQVAEVIRKGQDFLRGSQWIIGMTDPNGDVIDENHPYVGGFGYSGHGRPDLSNTQIALQAMHDTGVDCDDEVFQRALVFLNRLQATEANVENADRMAELDGGFIYAPSISNELIDQLESKANPTEMNEAANGVPVSNLRTYGSMTYAGFKSLLFANLDRDDPRVQAALGWIANNYELDHNPGMPEAIQLQGLYYYYLTMARAMNAYGSSTIQVNVAQPEGSTEEPTTEQRDWANDLIRTITALQAENGSWANTEAGRWMEDNPVLVTAYSVIALENTID